MSHHRRTTRTLGTLCAAIAVAVTARGAVAQGGLRYTIRGVVRDSASRAPLAGALVLLRSEGGDATYRTDDDGVFRFTLLPAGAYHLSALRIGFVERVADFMLARDTTADLLLAQAPVRLSEFLVTAETTAVYGAVGAYPTFDAIRGAKVEVIGAHAEGRTDSLGRFFVPVRKAGRYVVRMVADGFADHIFPVDVPKGRAAEASRLLEPGRSSGARAFDMRYKEMDLRIASRGLFATLVSGAEIRRAGGLISDAILHSESFYSRAMSLGPYACVYLNGVPRPGMAIDAIRPEDIEAIELYGDGPTGSVAYRLKQDWPPGASCGWVNALSNGTVNSISDAPPLPPTGDTRRVGISLTEPKIRRAQEVLFAVIWTRR